MGFSGIMKYLLQSEEWSAVVFPHSERKIFCGDTHYPGLTGLTGVTAHFRPENSPFQDALYQYIILVNLFIKKNKIEPKFVNPCL